MGTTSVSTQRHSITIELLRWYQSDQYKNCGKCNLYTDIMTWQQSQHHEHDSDRQISNQTSNLIYICYDLLTYLPHPNPCFALRSRL